MRIKILDVSIEEVKTARSSYQKANVAYMANGSAKTQGILSFVNPDTFKKVQQFVGQEVDVDITKNAKGYDEWAKVSAASGDAPAASTSPSAGAPAATRVTGSNYETPAERAIKQVYIVKQSSISAAINLVTANKEKASKEEIVATAQFFTDYVFAQPKLGGVDEMQSDEV